MGENFSLPLFLQAYYTQNHRWSGQHSAKPIWTCAHTALFV